MLNLLPGFLIVTSKLSDELEKFLENQNDSKMFSIKQPDDVSLFYSKLTNKISIQFILAAWNH